MSKRSVNDEAEHSESKKVKPLKLEFQLANEVNKVTFEKINEMVSLLEGHLETLRGTKLIVSIETSRLLDGGISIQLKTFEFIPPTNCIFAIELNGRKKEFTISEASDLLHMINPDKEAIVLDSLKNAIDDAMIFYGRLMECNRELNSVVDELKMKSTTKFGQFKLKADVVENALLMHEDLETIESQTLWQEWTTVAIAYLKYVFKDVDMKKRN